MNWTSQFPTSMYKPEERIVPRCKNCGKRLRGKNHDAHCKKKGV